MQLDARGMMDVSHLREWIGREESAEDFAALVPVRQLCATLDISAERFTEGEELPPLWHWLYFLPLHATADIAEDGHARKGGFLPDVPLPRRMWAGGRVDYHRPLRIGERMRRVSTIGNVEIKYRGESPMVFVTVVHRIYCGSEQALDEMQSLVYLPAASEDDPPPKKRPPPANAEWFDRIAPGTAMLFRYSALTFNSHRIHYDREYATGTEKYPGLVVHAPLTATLLGNVLARQLPDRRVSDITFRAQQPLFDTASFELRGLAGKDSATLWALAPNGGVAVMMEAGLCPA